MTDELFSHIKALSAANAAPHIEAGLRKRIAELEAALRDLVDRIDRNGGIGEYKGGPSFVMSRARAALGEATSK